MSEAALKELLSLPVGERVRLIELLWESLAEQEGFELTAGQRAELDRRMADHEANREDVASASEVLNSLPE